MKKQGVYKDIGGGFKGTRGAEKASYGVKKAERITRHTPS